MADRFLARQVASEHLPAWAAQALVEGLDSPTLRELAGLPRGEVREAQDLFRHALVELGAVLPAESASPGDLVLFWASRMVAGTVAPVNGANWIIRYGEDLGWPERLTHMLGLASMWDDWPEGRRETERNMVAAAQALLVDIREKTTE
jgi:hypothetical protein